MLSHTADLSEKYRSSIMLIIILKPVDPTQIGNRRAYTPRTLDKK